MRKLLLSALFLPATFFAQGYTSYFTGNPTNITTVPSPGTCVMGGATEHDNAMVWLLQKANGGDVVVLRSSGSNGYNDYLYSELGVTVNSVETLVITSVAGATNPYVLDKVANAEMIWFAGGDQYDYVSYFKDNALEDLINNHINVKHAPIGGTSAGMAILCGRYFSAQNGSVTSAEALANPYNPYVTLGNNDFLHVPFLSNATTDTHFDDPDRKGRLLTFLGRITTDSGQRSFGVACNEYVAVCIDNLGKATVYGDFPAYEEYAYFVQSNCELAAPENCQANQPLTWTNSGAAVKVYQVPGTMNGTNYFDLSDWQTGSGGNWLHWTANNGTFNETLGTAVGCSLHAADFTATAFRMYPVPFTNQITIEGFDNPKITISDLNGKVVYDKQSTGTTTVETSHFASGIYSVSVQNDGQTVTKKVIRN